MNTLDVLLRARAEVEKGWCQRRAVDNDGNVCALGAIETVLGVPKHSRAACEITVPHEVYAALVGGLPARSPWHIPEFNDNPATTKADVLALFDKAIASEAVKTSADPAHVAVLA